VLVPEPANARAHEPLAEDARFKPCLFSGYPEDLSVHLEFGEGKLKWPVLRELEDRLDLLDPLLESGL
jgi:hypothetical protein